MTKIFVNLKRFDVPKELGGICLYNNPKEWIEWVIEQSVKHGIGNLGDIEVVYLLSEAFIISAYDKLSQYPQEKTKTIKIGCQGIFREDIKKGGNFGAFTTNLPAAAAKNLKCSWAIIGHSEERKDKLNQIALYDSSTLEAGETMRRAKRAVDGMINNEVLCSLQRGINALLCVGETQEEKGDGSFEDQKPRIEAVLRGQLEQNLKSTKAYEPESTVVIGYEPIWAIGPGKTPPDATYVGFVSAYIKKIVNEMFGFIPKVVYGGGLKEENAEEIASVSSIEGGLVALTKFTEDIAFSPEDLRIIIDKYIAIKGNA